MQMTMTHQKTKTWIVIAAFNEAKRIQKTLEELHKNGYQNIVVVDDCSKDQTYEFSGALCEHTLRHPVNCGQGAALQTGIDYAIRRGAEYIVTFDADGQHKAEEISGFLEALSGGDYDIAIGSRFLGTTENMPFTRLCTLKAGILFTRLISRLKVTDTHNGFRAFTRQASPYLRMRQNRMAHASEILDLISVHKLRYCEVPTTISYNTEVLEKGQSSLNAIRIAVQFLFGKLFK